MNSTFLIFGPQIVRNWALPKCLRLVKTTNATKVWNVGLANIFCFDDVLPIAKKSYFSSKSIFWGSQESKHNLILQTLIFACCKNVKYYHRHWLLLKGLIQLTAQTASFKAQCSVDPSADIIPKHNVFAFSMFQFELWWEKDENIPKEAGIWPIF